MVIGGVDFPRCEDRAAAPHTGHHFTKQREHFFKRTGNRCAGHVRQMVLIGAARTRDERIADQRKHDGCFPDLFQGCLQCQR